MRIRVKFLIAFCAVLSADVFGDILYPDFVVSMAREGNDLSKLDAFMREDQGGDCKKSHNLKFYRTAYAKNILLARSSKDEYLIPKIIHQIWLGSPVPIKYREWMRSWANWQGWEYMLWTDEEVKSLLLYNQDLYDQSTNYGEKSDLLRLEILLHFGGIYADIDFECVNRDVLDELNRSYHFFIGFEPIDHGTINETYKICNAIIASCPHHPILKNLIANMGANWKHCENQTAVQKSGPDYFSRMIFAYEAGQLCSAEMKSDNLKYRNMYLPCTFLYPFSEPEIRGAKSHQELIAKKSPETAAIHYWSGSWFIPGGR